MEQIVASRPGFAIMKISRLITVLIFSLVVAASSYAKQNVEPYQIEGTEQTAAQGSYLVKVTVTSKKKNIEDAKIACCAVHGVLFRGFSRNGSLSSTKALAGNQSSEEAHSDFYSKFFKKGYATQYANTFPSSRSVVKVGKQYQITETVEVRKDQLRNYLEQEGVLRGLSTGF